MPTALASIVQTMAAAIEAATPLSRPGLRFARGPAVASLEATAVPARSRVFDVYAEGVVGIGDYTPAGYEIDQRITAEVSYQTPSHDEAWRQLAHEAAEDLATITAAMLHPDREAEAAAIVRARLLETTPIQRTAGRVFVRVSVAILYQPI